MGERLREFMLATYGDVLPLSVALRTSPATVYKWFSGASAPSAESLAKLHELGCDVRWLLVGVGEMLSDTEIGREWARQKGGKISKVAAAKPVDDRADHILRELREFITKHENTP